MADGSAARLVRGHSPFTGEVLLPYAIYAIVT
jgi:hypothetical protein